MTELEIITEFAKRKHVTFRIEHETFGMHKVEHTVFVFRNNYDNSIFPLIRVSFETREYEYLLENKKLGEQVNYELAVKLADIKAREELKKDLEFLKTLKKRLIMWDTNTYIDYCDNCHLEMMKIVKFASKNGYLLTSDFSTVDKSMIYIFLPMRIPPVDEYEDAHPRIRTCNEISIEIDKDLCIQLILNCKLADYVIEKVKERIKED
mgnify:CR=1 FL=1